MKILLSMILGLFLAINVFSDTYVVADKTTGEPLGITSISDEYVPLWQEKYILIQTKDTFKGKYGYEIEIKNGEAKLKSKADVDKYLEDKKKEAETARLLKFKEDMIKANQL